MDLYLAIVVIMLVLAVAGLVVGVSNDAVNFLNSALGSKAAPRYVIMTVASVGIIVGAITSSGMMEVARSGVFHPQMFTFAEVMLLFLAVMFTNVILLDLFNTLGMPTSTTVSLVFGLLGAAVGICVFKLSSGSVVTMPDGDPASMADMINTGNAMAIIGGILISVAIAFVCGTVVMYITRLIFSFRYQKKLRTVGALWCGIALTAISYFAVFKGLKGTSVIPAHAMAWMEHHTLAMLAAMVAGWSLLMSLLSLLKINILRLTVLAGTFSLALAFAGNDLVNFIGVFVAGVDAYDVAKTTGDSSMLMGSLNDPVVANMLILFLSGLVMVVTLWFSKKARAVSDTEINLARQDVGVERFGSTSISRAIVRSALNVNRNYEKYTPDRIQRFVASRFVPVLNRKDKAPFDLIRATVNLTVASILISSATSLQLPLSTTYVTFMVAMGSSLSDRAWGRESAVYRITGVMAVISGWFITALGGFLIAFVVGLALIYGGTPAFIVITLLCGYMLIHSNFLKKNKESAIVKEHEDTNEDIIANLRDGFRAVAASRGLLLLIVMVTIGMMIFGPLSAVFPLMTYEHFSGDGYMASLVEAAFGIGMLVGSGILMAWGGGKRLAGLIAVAAVIVGATTAACGLLPPTGFVAFVVLVAVMAMACAWFNGPTMTLTQRNVSDEKMGRAMGLLNAAMGLATPIGIAIGGVAAELMGVAPFFVVDGIACLVLGLVAYIPKSIRALDEG